MHATETLGLASLRNTQSYRLASRHVDQTFTIDVAPPPFGIQPGRVLPVIFVLDGDMTFAGAAQTARALQMGPNGLPPALVVGVGYAGGDGMARRLRDLTPSIDQRYLTMARATPGPFALPTDVVPGGADAFLAFLHEELKPFIASRYPIDPDDQTLAGLSLGGLFVLHVLFTQPRAFRRWMAMSPSIWWDERRVLAEEAALAERVMDLDARLFLSVGALEEAEDASARMVSNLYELEATLRGREYPGLSTTAVVFPEESHMSVFPAAFSRGVRAVFG